MNPSNAGRLLCFVPVRRTASLRLVLIICCFVTLAAIASACGDDDGADNEATPPAVRTASAQARAAVIEAEDVGDGWDALPDDSGTPDVAAGTDAIIDRAFKSWAGCVGNLLSGGFVGIGRAGVASSPRFADGSGRVVAGASAVFVDKARADQVVESLRISGEFCGGIGENFRVELSDVPVAPDDAAASYRMTATLMARTGDVTSTFDLVVLRTDLVVSSLVFKGFGADESGQSDVIAKAKEKLP
jgi:hypothetical protein